MSDVAVALVHLGLILASLTGLLEVGVLAEACVASLLGHLVQTFGKLFSGFQARSGTLDVALNGLEVVLGGEATSGISGGHNSGCNRFHCGSQQEKFGLLKDQS
jgi:hypothetical protein